MIPYYAGDPLLHSADMSIFLAGPTPREAHVKSWRPEALSILEAIGFPGGVYVPEPPAGPMGTWPEYDDQCNWEQERLEKAGVIVFWIPRDMMWMPALTTNIEFGLYASSRCASRTVALGFPREAPHMRYVEYCARQWGIRVRHNLRDTLADAVVMCR